MRKGKSTSGLSEVVTDPSTEVRHGDERRRREAKDSVRGPPVRDHFST
jgi:hypothetical protein